MVPEIGFLILGNKKVHYTFPKGSEMVEEYNMDTHVVTRRAWKVNKRFADEPEWEVEIGDPNSLPTNLRSKLDIQETNTAVSLHYFQFFLLLNPFSANDVEKVDQGLYRMEDTESTLWY